MDVSVEESVVSASAGRPGRSISKRFSSSDEKCWASAAEPPLPQERTFPSSCRQRLIIAAPAAMADVSASTDSRLIATLSSKWFLTRSSGVTVGSPVRDADGSSPGPRGQGRNASRVHSRVLSPSPPEIRTTGAQPHLDDDEQVALTHHEVELAESAGVIPCDRREAPGDQEALGTALGAAAAAGTHHSSRVSGSGRRPPSVIRAQSSSRRTLRSSVRLSVPVSPCRFETALRRDV